MLTSAKYASALLLLAQSYPVVLAAPVNDDYEVITEAAMSARIPTQAAFQELTMAGSRSFAVGDYGLVLWRDNPVDTWQQAAVETSVMLTAVDFADAENGWAVGHHGVIIHTTDGGKTWQRQLTGFDLIKLEQDFYTNQITELEAELAAAEEAEADAMTLDDLTFALDDAIFLLENAERAEAEGPTKPLLDVFAIDAETILVSGAYGTMLRSVDGGTTWEVISNRVENPDGYHLNVMVADEDYLYLAGEAGLLYRTGDAGDTWETLNSPYNGSFFGSHIDNENNYWVYGLRGNVFRSADQGESFEEVESGTAVNLSGGALDADGSTILVGQSGVISRIPADGDAQVTGHSSGDVLTDIQINLDGSYTLVGQGGVLQLLPSLPERQPTAMEGQD